MEVQHANDDDDGLSGRVQLYRTRWTLYGVRDRVAAVDIYLSHHDELLRHRATALAGGAFRAAVGTALDLGGTPAATWEASVAKRACLRAVIGRLVERAVDTDHLVIGPMLAEAVAAERRHWPGTACAEEARCADAAGARPRVGIGPVLRDRYRRCAEPQKLARIGAHAALTTRDAGVLRARGDMPSVVGALDELRSSLLGAAATPSGGPCDLDAKVFLLARHREVLRPPSLLRPMLETALSADLLRVDTTPEREAALVAALSWAVG